MTEHRIAITPDAFAASLRGERCAEHRYEHPDKPYHVGDAVILEELTTMNPRRRELTGRMALRWITYIDRQMGIKPNYALLHLGTEGD